MFDPTADPENVAARAAELSLEQLKRLRQFMESNPETPAAEFYSNLYEASISNQIGQLMAAYAILKGYVTLDEANR